MDFNKFQNAIKSLDEMYEHLIEKEYAEKDDGIGLYVYPTGECQIQPIGWHSKDFDTIEEFVEYMENKSWIIEFE